MPWLRIQVFTKNQATSISNNFGVQNQSPAGAQSTMVYETEFYGGSQTSR